MLLPYVNLMGMRQNLQEIYIEKNKKDGRI